MPKIKLVIDTGFAGARWDDEIEIPDDEWNKMDEKERNQLCDDELQDYLSGRIDAYWEIVE